MKHLKNLVLVASSIVLIGVACTKDTTTTTTLVGNWVKRSGFDGNARAGAACFVINNIAYIGTGYDGTSRYNDLWAFDAAANSGKGAWTQKMSMPTAAGYRNSAAAFAIGTNGYIVGGACDANLGYNGKLNDTWEYNSLTDTWNGVAKATLPNTNATIGSGARYGAVGFAINGKGYVSCGFTGSHTKDMYEYDNTLDKWTAKTSMPSTDKRTGAAVMVYGNKAYIVGGSYSGVAVNEMWVYDPSNDSWAQKRNITNTSTDTYDDAYITIARSNAVAFVIGDKGYLTTGTNGSYTSNTWEYDFANGNDTWIERTKFERADRSDAVGFTVNGRGFVALGKNSTQYLENVEEFLPTATYDAND